MAYAVVACSRCRSPWLVELRHKTASCPGCGQRADLARRTRLWQGGDIAAARAAVADHRAALAQGVDLQTAQALLAPEKRLVRHDTLIDAAAAKARDVRSTTARAEAVAIWLTRLSGPAPHDDWVKALTRAGLDKARAEKEIVRMLATDIIYEPRVGHYAHLAP